MLKKIFKIGFLFIGIVVLFYYIFITPLKLVKTADRHYPEYPLSEELKERIRRETKDHYDISAVEYSLSLTASLLDFSAQNDIENGIANCIGYTRLCVAICNYALQIHGYKERVTPVVGYIEWHGINLCDVAQTIVPKKYRAFFKDHDFIELGYLKDEYVYIDPTFFDLTWNDCETRVKK